MARLDLLVVAILLVSMACGATLKHHSLEVYENGVQFKQTTDIDVKNRVIYIHVPGHRNIPECQYIFEYNTGRVLRCLPSTKQCYMSNFDTKSLPDPAEEEIDLQAFARHHKSPKIEAKLGLKKVEDMVITEKIINLNTISKLMRKAVGSYDLYREEPLPKDAEIMEGTVNPNALKEKREFFYVPPCPGRQDPVKRYAQTKYHCNYMRLCSKPGSQGTCRWIHLMGGDYFTCGCCTHERSPGQCRYGCRNDRNKLFAAARFYKLGWRNQ